jgi:hypothetical protein
MKKILTLSILTLSISGFAQVDYSECQIPFSSYAIDSEGKITDYQGKELVKKEVKDGIESYQIQTGGFYGGGLGDQKQIIHIARDEKGNIQSVVEGSLNVSKSDLEKLKEIQLNTQIMMAKPGLTGQYGYGFGGGYGGPGINDKNFKSFNITKEELKDLKKDWRKDKKLSRKVRRIIKKMQDSGKGYFPLGTESKFVVKNNKCEPVEKSNRSYSEEQKKIISGVIHSKAACSKVAKLFVKHKQQMQKCDVAHQAVSKDLYSDASIMKDISLYPGMGMGMGGYVGFGGGMGSYSTSPISNHVNVCRTNYPSLFNKKDFIQQSVPITGGFGSAKSGSIGF